MFEFVIILDTGSPRRKDFRLKKTTIINDEVEAREIKYYYFKVKMIYFIAVKEILRDLRI